MREYTTITISLDKPECHPIRRQETGRTTKTEGLRDSLPHDMRSMSYREQPVCSLNAHNYRRQPQRNRSNN